MKQEKRECVHKVLWDWCLLWFREHPEDRQDVVRTLHRLVSTQKDLLCLLSLSKVDASFQVFSTVLWAFYRHTRAIGFVEHALPVLQYLLQHRSLSRRLLCCEMLRRLWKRGLVPRSIVDRFGHSIRSILRHHPRHEQAVFVVTKYVMEVPSPPIAPATLLPCGGMAWVKAIEYISKFAPHDHLPARLLAPWPSSHDADDLVKRWPVEVQHFYVQAAAASGFEALVGGRLLSIMAVLSHLTKVPGLMGPIIPGVLRVLESVHAPFVTTDQRYDLWESSWRILERHPPPHCFASRLWKILSTCPDLSASWCKDQIRSVLGAIGAVPEEFVVPLLRVLPRQLVTTQSSAIARLLVKKCCALADDTGERFCWRIGCVDFCCAVDAETYQTFIQDHIEVYRQALMHVDARVRLRARHMLSRVPAALFEASVPLLSELISEGDVSCMIAIQNLCPERKRRFAPELQDLVLARTDLYSDDGRPSIALVTFAGLPRDILEPIAKQIIPRIAFSRCARRSTPPTIWDARTEDRLFLLGHLPTGILDPEAAAHLCDQYWTGRTLALALRILHNTKNVHVYNQFKYRCFGVVAWGDEHLKPLALSVLRGLPTPVLETLLATLDMTTVSPTYTCKLWELTSPAFLNERADALVQLCGDNIHLECCLDLLAAVSPSPLEHLADKIVALAAQYEQEGIKWPSLRTVLRKIGDHERVDEMLFTKEFFV